LANATSDCSNLAGTPAADQHMPTIVVPAGVYNNVHAKFTFNISWDAGAGNDEILTVLNPDGSALDSADTGEPSETVTGNDLPGGEYKVVACGFVSGPLPQSYTGKLTIETLYASGPQPPPPTPTPTPAIPGGPRYSNYSPGPGVGETAGEPSMGYNLATHKAMYISGLQTLRVTFPDTGACEANWEDVSYLVTKTRSLDPILFTDQHTNRTFVSQLDSVPPPAGPSVYVGLNSFMAYTDDDGATWTPAQVNPPDGSYDHQSVGAGPYPTVLPLGNAVNKGDAVYYCSQAGVTAFCSRSDDGGLNFNRPVAIYNAVTDGCGGIHGHVKVANDGTVYVPNYSCGASPAVVVSDNAGITWSVRPITGATSPSVILDPSIGIATDGTLYVAYINDAGEAHVAVSHDKGVTWVNDQNLGTSQNIANAVFVEAIAGDANRAAVGFLGTTQTGNHEAADFNGDWYLFMAHTYDGGANWITVNATPNDPVQRNSCIWNEGGSNVCRNLLDFNEITMDEKGRVLYSYSDGCVDGCVSGGPNSYTSKATIARETGGKGLLQQYDVAEPLLPQAACLTGRRDDMASYLQWRTPDNGGSDLTGYNIYRGTAANNVTTLVGQAAGSKASFNDRTTDPSVATYYYKIAAVNSLGEGVASNVVPLTVGNRFEPTGACSQPGVQVLVDPAGDENDTVAMHDVTSLSISEPESLPGKVVFTMKIASLSQPLTPAFRWSVRFNVPNYGPPVSTVIGPQEDWFVSMITSDNATPTFTYGTTGSFSPGGVDVPARFFTTIGNLDPASGYTADGTITLILNKSDIQSRAVCTGTCGALQPGQAININLASVRAAPPSQIPGAGGTNETIPDTTGPGTYNLRPANLCLSNAAPLAVLNANVNEGVKPLAVQFDGSASHDDDAIDHIATYTFNFGEGADDVVQTTPVISHTFTKSGLYDVKLVATDSRGKLSSNTAHQLVQVDLPLQSIVSRKTHGAQTFDVDLPPGGKAGIECRSGGANGDFTIVYTFVNNLTGVDSASVNGTGSIVSRNIGPNANQYTVNLTGVANSQHLFVMLNGAHTADGSTFFGINARMDVLTGDTTADGVVNSTDIAQTKSQSGQALTSSNFREDVTVDGNLNSTDISLVKSKSGTGLPAANEQPSADTTSTTSAQPASTSTTSSSSKKTRQARARSQYGF
jgi:hypothetical protein